MLRFKQFISSYLTEATIRHFAHLGLDPDNQEHNDLVDAYNLGHSKNDPNVPRNPNQIKSLEHLTSVAAPRYKEIQLKRKEEARHQKAIKSGHAELVHHDPKTGVKVFRVKNAKGCAAVGSSKWCVSQPGITGQTHFNEYDLGGEHSYVIHTPEKGNLSRIGIIGVKPHDNYIHGNFQDKGNVPVTNKDWEMLRKKYKLDSISHLHGIRGIVVPEIKAQEELEHIKTIKNPESSTKELHKASEFITSPETDEIIANHKNADDALLHSILWRNKENIRIHDAIVNHKNSSRRALGGLAALSKNPEIEKKIINHENTHDDALSSIADRTNDPETLENLLHHKKTNILTLLSLLRKTDDPEKEKFILNKVESLDSY